MRVQDGAGFWDLDEPLPGVRRRLVRSATVAGAWAFAALPLVLGGRACLVAAVLHEPCPGCGMTRALRLFLAGDVQGSLRMHPLALPMLVASALVAASTVWATFRLGSPVRLWRTRLGRAALALVAATYAATLLLWVARWFGFFGGPVPVG
jgi:hypothetical protein